jgi:hypothetical protein
MGVGGSSVGWVLQCEHCPAWWWLGRGRGRYATAAAIVDATKHARSCTKTGGNDVKSRENRSITIDARR